MPTGTQARRAGGDWHGVGWSGMPAGRMLRDQCGCRWGSTSSFLKKQLKAVTAGGGYVGGSPFFWEFLPSFLYSLLILRLLLMA